MATRPLRSTERTRVRLRDIPIEVRLAEAEKLVKAYRLGFIDALMITGAAQEPVENPSLVVPVWKAEKILAGKRIGAATLDGLWPSGVYR